MHRFVMVIHNTGISYLINNIYVNAGIFTCCLQKASMFLTKITRISNRQTNRQDLERVQKAAVKVILGKDYLNYEEALGELKLENLDERREAMAIKFVKKSLENSNFSKLFPLREVKHGMRVRKSEKYVVKTSKTNRHKDSAVPYLQKLLNKDYIEKRQNLKRILEIPQVVKNDRELKRKRVNYVSHVDVIT